MSMETWLKVYIDNKNGEYIGKRVSAGIEAEGYVEILSGISVGESVVVQGSFLLDSQSQLSGGQESLYGNSLDVEEKKDTKSGHK